LKRTYGDSLADAITQRLRPEEWALIHQNVPKKRPPIETIITALESQKQLLLKEVTL
jgi:hypothetical protein